MASEVQLSSIGGVSGSREAVGGTQRYIKLLNGIAKDLDCMLSELYESSKTAAPAPAPRPPPRSTSERSRFHLSTQPPRNNNNGTTTTTSSSSSFSLPHASPSTHALLQPHRPSTLPRIRSGVCEQRGWPVDTSHGNTSDNIKTNPTGAQALGGGAGQLSEKLPGVDGYQNDAHRVSPKQQDKTAAQAVEAEEEEEDYAHPCHMSILERLLVTHPVWLLREIYRAGAVHLLQGKEEGNFIIRQSSRRETMAITVRLPPDKGPYIEHYLIEAIDGKMRLEGSDYHFPAIHMLVSHYCQCCDELPVRLKLPRAVADAASKQELSALALLGQEFWMSPLANCTMSRSPKSKPALPLPSMANNSTATRPSFSTFTSASTTTTSGSNSSSSGSSPPSSAPTSPSKKTAPPPPPRRSLSSPSASSSSPDVTNFTVTTTVTFHVNRCTAPLPIQVQEEQVKAVGEEKEVEVMVAEVEPTLTAASTTSTLSRRSVERHHSPLESPPGYHRSSLADKISDYEDIWVSKPSPEDSSSNQTDLEKALARLSLNAPAARHSRVSKLHRHSDPSLRCSPVHSSSKSSCNSEPETLSRSEAGVDDEGDAGGGGGGIVNNGFESSSSQLLNESEDEEEEDGSTLSRGGDKHNPEFLKDIQELMVEHSVSPTATLKDTQNNNRSFNQNSWPLDFSWEFRSRNGSTLYNDSSTSSSSIDHEDFMTEDDEVALVELRSRPTHPRSPFRVFSASTNSSSVVATVEQLLTERQPQLKVPEIRPLTHSNLLRVSEYDNLGSSETSEEEDSLPPPTRPPTLAFEQTSNVSRLSGASNAAVELRVRNVPSEAGSSMTEFSEPWDSHRWEAILLHAAALNQVAQSNDKVSTNGHSPAAKEPEATPEAQEEVEEEDLGSVSSVTEGNSQRTAKIPVLPCLLSLRRKDRRQGRPIRDYVFKMAQDKDLIFGRCIENFIACTLESHENSPHVVMRNIRQFMSGMANFLVNSGEGKFSELVQEQRAKLKANEFLNLDAILEGVLHRIVVKPLKQHIYQLFVKAYSANGAVAMLSDSIKFARTRTPEQLGLKPNLKPPKAHSMEKIKYYLTKLQKAYSPLKKLENLLAAISFIYQSILQDREGEHQSLGADDFLPLLLYVLVHCGLIAAEVEADYMWGLLHPSLLSGEGGYYLTTLSSAVHVLKNLHRCHDIDKSLTKQVSPDGRRLALCLGELDGFMKVLIPNEQNGSIISKTVPVRPNMTSKDICRMVAHRLSVTNPQDYALFKLVNGEEVLLSDSCYPWMIRMELAGAGLEVAFVYKRVDAKMAWPVSLKRN